VPVFPEVVEGAKLNQGEQTVVGNDGKSGSGIQCCREFPKIGIDELDAQVVASVKRQCIGGEVGQGVADAEGQRLCIGAFQELNVGRGNAAETEFGWIPLIRFDVSGKTDADEDGIGRNVVDRTA